MRFMMWFCTKNNKRKNTPGVLETVSGRLCWTESDPLGDCWGRLHSELLGLEEAKPSPDTWVFMCLLWLLLFHAEVFFLFVFLFLDCGQMHTTTSVPSYALGGAELSGIGQLPVVVPPSPPSSPELSHHPRRKLCPHHTLNAHHLPQPLAPTLYIPWEPHGPRDPLGVELYRVCAVAPAGSLSPRCVGGSRCCGIQLSRSGRGNRISTRGTASPSTTVFAQKAADGIKITGGWPQWDRSLPKGPYRNIARDGPQHENLYLLSRWVVNLFLHLSVIL